MRPEEKFSLCLSPVPGPEAPETPAGKLVGAMCAVFGIFTLILPIPIVVNSFSAFYRNRLWRNEVAIKRRERLLVHPGANGTNKDQQQSNNALFELNGVTTS